MEHITDTIGCQRHCRFEQQLGFVHNRAGHDQHFDSFHSDQRPGDGKFRAERGEQATLFLQHPGQEAQKGNWRKIQPKLEIFEAIIASAKGT